MAATIDDNQEVISSINVTPFVDVVLVLLIILMVTSTQIVRAAIGVDLPRAASAGTAVASTLNIVVQKDGSLLLDGEQIDESLLAQFVSRESKKKKDLQAVIAADRGVAYGRVVRVIDIVKAGGVTRFALNIERDVPKEADS